MQHKNLKEKQKMTRLFCTKHHTQSRGKPQRESINNNSGMLPELSYAQTNAQYVKYYALQCHLSSFTSLVCDLPFN